MAKETIKTEKENLIKLREKVSFRRTEAKANMVYWKLVFKESKKDSQQRVDAHTKIGINQKSMKNDRVFLECIDRLIAGEN